MEAKKGNITIYSKGFKLFSDCVVGLSFKVNASGCVLNKLKNNQRCECHPVGTEEACVCYAIFHVVNDFMCGEPMKMEKSKVSQVNCGFTNHQFTLSWHIKNNLTAIRKSLRIAVSALKPAKLYTLYAGAMKMLGHKPDKEVFIHVANEITSSLKREIEICILGNIKLDTKKPAAATDTKKPVKTGKQKLEDTLDAVLKKFAPEELKGAGKKPSDHKKCTHEDEVELAACGWEAVVLMELIRMKTKNSPSVEENALIVKMKPASWPVLKEKLKNSANDFATRLANINDINSVIAFRSLDRGVLNVKDAITLCEHATLTAVDIQNAFKTLLK